MRTTTFVGGLIIVLVGAAPAMGSPDPSSSSSMTADKTLSPYFYIEDGDSTVDRVPLESTKTSVMINGVIADVTIRQRYRNRGKKPISARYVFPASTRAAVHAMSMQIGENLVRAEIQERARAKETFEKAKREGKSASLLEQNRPNVFSMSVSNIMPGDVVDIELAYTELLVPTEGTYEFVCPTVVGPRYSSQPEATAAESDRWVKNPYLGAGEAPRSTFELDVGMTTPLPLAQLACSSHKTSIQWDGKNAATLTLDPAERIEGGNRDFILHYRLDGGAVQSGLMLFEGEEENFFLLMMQPPQRVRADQIPAREYVFVVDVSGSMNGFPLNVAKKLLRDLIGSLRQIDTFNLILFAGGSYQMAPKSVPATQGNIAQAIRVLDAQRGGGGTELAMGIRRALGLPRDPNVSRSVIVVTDGFISAERQAFDLIHDNLQNTNVFSFGIGSSVNRFLVEGIARAGLGEAFIVSASDEAPAIAERFRTYVQTPVLTDVRFEARQGFEVYAAEPHALPDLLAERPIVVCGKYRGGDQGQIHVTGMSGEGAWSKTIDLSEVEPTKANEALRYLWARTRIATLSDWAFGNPNDEQVRETTSLGLTYNLLTKHTSFVAVLQEVRNKDGETEDVTQPLPIPKGVSNLAVGGISGGTLGSGSSSGYGSGYGSGVVGGDEPDLILLGGLLLLIVFAHLLRRRWRAART